MMQAALYDFTKYQPLSDVEKARLHELSHQFSENASDNQLQLTFDSIEKRPFSVFFYSLPETTYISTWELHPLNCKGLLILDAQLVYSLVAAMLGGNQRNQSFVQMLNNLEMAIYRKWSYNFLSMFLQNTEDKSFTIYHSETRANLSHAFQLNEPCVNVRFHATFNGLSGDISLIIPTVCLEAFLSLGNVTVNPVSTTKPQPIVVSALEITLKALLGKTVLFEKDLNSLQIGDIIPLNQQIANPIDVYIGDDKALSAKPGLAGKHKGIFLCQN